MKRGKKANTSSGSYFRSNLLKSKLAAEMTIGTIIVIILALVVLVLLILGFTTGWGNLWDKLIALGPGGQANVDTIVQACNIACTTNSQFEYCRERDVRFGKDYGDKSVGSLNIEDGEVTASCKLLEANKAGIGIDLNCPAITCPCKEDAIDCTQVALDDCVATPGCEVDTSADPNVCKEDTIDCTTKSGADCLATAGCVY